MENWNLILTLLLILQFAIRKSDNQTIVDNFCCSFDNNANCQGKQSPEFYIKKYNSATYSEDVTSIILPYYNNSKHQSGYFFPNFTNEELIQLSCTAPYPIEIKITGEMAVHVSDLRMERKVQNYSNDCTYQYYIRFDVALKYAITGNYICQQIYPLGKEASAIYLFVNDLGNIDTLLNSELGLDYLEVTGIPSDDGLIKIPCISTNPYVKPQLFKENRLALSQEEIFQSTEKGKYYVQYIPGEGFVISPSANVSSYFCKMGNQSLTLSLKYFVSNTGNGIPRHFRLVPNNPDKLIIFRNKMAETLSCESNLPVTFSPQTMNLGSDARNPNLTFEVTHEFQRDAYYRYKTTIFLQGQLSLTINIICVYNDTQDHLHEWKFSPVKGTEASSRPGITFRSDQHFQCISSNNQAPFIAVVSCFNPINCESANRFSHLVKRKPEFYPFNVTKGFNCATWTWTKSPGCAIIPTKILDQTGLVMCQESLYPDDVDNVEPVVEYLNYYTGFRGNIIHVLNQETSSELVQLVSADDTIYVEETVKFTCEASAFIFALGMQFFVHSRNQVDNTTIIQLAKDYDEKLTSEQVSENGKIKTSLTIQLKNSDTFKIECSVPLWSSSSWYNVSLEINVLEGTCVKMDQTTETITILPNENNKSLTCEASGNPKPTIKWKKDDQNISTITNTKVLDEVIVRDSFGGHGGSEDDDEITRSTLIFTDIKDFHNGTYTCHAKSRRSTAKKQFNLIVQKNPDGYLLYVAIIGGVAAILIVMIIIVAFGVVRRQKLYMTKEEINEFTNGNGINTGDVCENVQNGPYNKTYELPLERFQIETSSLLGSGQYGNVFKGTYTNSTVAVKTLKPGAEKSYLKALLSELKVMTYINGHQHIIQLIGANTQHLDKGLVYLLIEFCSLGSLENFLRSNSSKFIQSSEMFVDDLNNKFTLVDLACWSFQLTDAMGYLSDKGVIHGDLATRNILLYNKQTIKLTDFGLARKLYHYTTYTKTTKEPLPWMWLSIESLRNQIFSTKSDVWSFGVTIGEIYSLGQLPYPGLAWTVHFTTALENGLRMAQPRYCTDEMYQMLLKCWSLNPDDRPTFGDLNVYFKSVLDSLSSNPQLTSSRDVMGSTATNNAVNETSC